MEELKSKVARIQFHIEALEQPDPMGHYIKELEYNPKEAEQRFYENQKLFIQFLSIN